MWKFRRIPNPAKLLYTYFSVRDERRCALWTFLLLKFFLFKFHDFKLWKIAHVQKLKEYLSRCKPPFCTFSRETERTVACLWTWSVLTDDALKKKKSKKKKCAKLVEDFFCLCVCFPFFITLMQFFFLPLYKDISNCVMITISSTQLVLSVDRMARADLLYF